MKKIYVIIVLFIGLKTFSQKGVSIEIVAGVGINDELILNNEEIEDYSSFTTQVYALFPIKIYKDIYASTGLGLQSYFSSGSLLLSNFRVNTLRLNIPLLLNTAVFKKIDIGAGIVLTHNRELNEIDFRANYNLRTSLLFKTSYQLNEKLALQVIVKNNLTDIPNLYYINQPKMDVSLGASFKLF